MVRLRFSTAAARLAASACLIARADFGFADLFHAAFFTGDFFAVARLPDTAVALPGFAACLAVREVTMMEELCPRHYGMRPPELGFIRIRLYGCSSQRSPDAGY
jgi:hypothetical protein